MAEETDRPEDEAVKSPISLYEFYAIAIERLVEKAPWELERAVSKYHESFLTEQRCLGLSILLLLGEEQVPKKLLQGVPKFEAQTRTSVNQAVFRGPSGITLRPRGLTRSGRTWFWSAWVHTYTILV